MTADCLGIPVLAGPVEATALGNILLQLIALGDLKSIDEGRAVIRAQEQIRQYRPENSKAWEIAYEKFCTALCRQ